MNTGTAIFLGLVALAVAAGVVWAVRVYRGEGEVKRLRQEYARLMNLPPSVAYESMERRIEALMKKHPDRPMAFYLRYLVEELRRDRRD